MIVPTRRLAFVCAAASVFAAVGAAATDGQVSWWAWVLGSSGVVLLAGLVDGLLAGRGGDLTVERDAPAVAVVGVEADLSWRWHNRSARAVEVAFADQLAPSLGSVRRGQVTVPAHGRAQTSAQLCPARRGRFEINDLVIRIRGPLAIAARQQTRAMPATIRVVPSFRSRAAVELRLDQNRLLDLGTRSSRGRGGGSEFAQLREYVVGDDFRRVDWGATGRVGRPIMREYAAEQHQNVIVLVDNGRIMAGRIGDVPRIEFAIDAAMSMSAATQRTRDRIGLITFDRRVRAQIAQGASRSNRDAMMSALFDLEPELSESDYVTAVAEALRRHRRRSLFVLLTELVEPVVAESLAPAVAALSGRHQVIVAAARDPKVEQWARTSRDGSSDDAYLAASAASSLESRRRARSLLERAGAIVVDEQPAELGWNLVDAYLGLKTVGRF